MKQLFKEEELVEVLNQQGPVFLLKHSTTCPISQAAYGEYEKFSVNNPDVNCYFLTVQESRDLSNLIADKFDVKHESPQAFLFRNNDVSWHASHWKITNTALNSVLNGNA